MSHDKRSLVSAPKHLERGLKLCACNLSTLSIVIFALSIWLDGSPLGGQQFVQAARIRGLIYNRDGKFIYRPSRASQAHIIVIDDRSPKTTTTTHDENGASSNKTEADRSPVANNQQEAASSQVNASLMQLLGPQQLGQAGLKALYPSGGPFQFVKLDDLSPLNPLAPHLTHKEISNRVSQAPSGLANFMTPGGVQMVPLIQFVPQQTLAAISSRAAGTPDALTYGSLMNPLLGSPNDLGASVVDAPFEPYQASRSSRYRALHAFYQLPLAKQRQLAAAYSESLSPYGPQHLYPEYSQQRMESNGADPGTFDEPLAPSRGGNNPYSSQMSHQQLLKSRRATGLASSQQAQDLDDLEGDHVDYYDSDGRDSSRGSYGRSVVSAAGGSGHRQYYGKSSAYGSDPSERLGGYQRHQSSLAYSGYSDGASSRSSPTGQQSSSLGATGGALSDVRPVGSSKRSNSSNKLKSSLPKSINAKLQAASSASGLDESPGGIDGRDLKSTQYWKQYQDQFEMLEVLESKIMLIVNGILAGLLLLAAVKYSRFHRKRKRLTDAISKLPGPPEPRIPILANIRNTFLYELVCKDQFDAYVLMYHELMSLCQLFLKEGIYRFWLSWTPVVVLFSPETIEPILTSNTIINKSEMYYVIEPWVGQGLLTSNGNKWRSRRKIITPAFHFRILNDFLPTMNRSATTLIRKLNNLKYRSLFDINPPISLCTLDTISNTAMGIDLNCQADEHSDYVEAIDEIQRLAFQRVTRPWLWPDWIFYRTIRGKKFSKVRDLMHTFTKGVILKRKIEWEGVLSSQGKAGAGNGIMTADKKQLTFDEVLSSESFKNSSMRMAFLDLLLHQHLVEKNLTIDDINEEVSTFMFEGHDTTASNITWALYHLGHHPDIQDRVRAELDEIFGEMDEEEAFQLNEARMSCKLKTTDVTNEHLSRMKYLEMVIKETLRLTPTAPFVARNVTEDIKVGGKYVVPAGSLCVILAHALHTNSLVYESPQKFDPERFSPENNLKRHPFAHIPFSAGPRNCIGQRFALMEAKVILAKVVRNYVIETEKPMDKLRLVAEMILKSDVGLQIRLRPRFQ